jgi:hypothetical protein
VNSGYVYILTNEAMPGIVKIGRTSREVDLRAAELWQTGVPQPFEVFAFEKTCDCVQLEAYMHGDLREPRVHRSREFFRIEPEVALEKLRFWAGLQAHEFMSDNFTSITASPLWLHVSGEAVERLAKDLGEDTLAITDGLNILTAEEILPAVRRAKAVRKAEMRERMRGYSWPEDEIEEMLAEGRA